MTQLVKQTSFLDIPGCTFSKVGLSIDPEITFDHWQRLVQILLDIECGVQFWIGDALTFGENHPKWGDKTAQAIEANKKTGINVETIRAWMRVSENVEIGRRLPNLSWSHHQAVASLKPSEQSTWLKKAEVEGISVHDLRNDIRRAETLTLIEKGTPKFSDEKYSVVYADPPWQYDFAETENRAIENQYPTMPVEEICELPIDELAADDSVLFLWATSPKLREALRVVEAWGFDYKTCMVWYKDKIGMGYYARQQHELLLVAKRGDFPVPLPENRPPSVVQAPRTKHSAKPAQFYELLERMYPGYSKIELFCRQPREGWVAWGNEVQAA